MPEPTPCPTAVALPGRAQPGAPGQPDGRAPGPYAVLSVMGCEPASVGFPSPCWPERRVLVCLRSPQLLYCPPRGRCSY